MSKEPKKYGVEHEPIISQIITEPDINHLGVVIPGSSARVISCNDQPSLTRQADADRACIHNILSQYRQSGHLPMTQAVPLDGDLVVAEDYMQAMNVVAAVNSQFEMLPVEIRERFAHRPEKLLAFAANPDNAPELIKMGLARAPEVAATSPHAEQKQGPAGAAQEGAPAPSEGGAGAAQGTGAGAPAAP